MNNYIKDTNAKADSETVVIRMSDFYPENVGDQEFCEVSREVYEELLRFKAIDEGSDPDAVEPDNTPTVIIRIKDFYPKSNSKTEYKEVSRKEYEKLVADRAALMSSIPKEDTRKVFVNTEVFYPYIQSSEEYAVISFTAYEKLLKMKVSVPYDGETVTAFGKPTTPVRINVKEFFPDVDMEYNDVNIEIYEELLRYKTYKEEFEKQKAHIGNKQYNGDIVRIRISDFYPDNCCEAEYCDVSRKVYEELINNKKEDHATRVKDSRYIMNYCFDEIICGEKEGIYTASSEKELHLIILLRNLLVPYGEHYVRRGVMYFINGYSPATIAMLEKVSCDAIWKSIRKIKSIVQIAGIEYFGL